MQHFAAMSVGLLARLSAGRASGLQLAALPRLLDALNGAAAGPGQQQQQADAGWAGQAQRSLSTTTPAAGPSGRARYSEGSSTSWRDREMHATTILCVRKDGKTVLIGDGQVRASPFRS
jgi:hypothetical protein